ncbi:hypothetical protein [uncultured Tenacibaculum sp.]|uniref:hypothetical protein n=1 Tax=uncultured Tenacibaculum sp. TaxID=174713 RepID=UPI002604575D|nr:hypothetical protein [uncultured Tenacibaculum sp.]
MKKLNIFFLNLFIIQSLLSQEQKPEQQLYSFLDNTINNVNTKLSYGDVYKEKYIKKTKNNHNFFDSSTFKKGSIIYRNEVFYDVLLKYEIVDDYVIIKLSNLKQNLSIIPGKRFVESFQIDTISFINTKQHGFLEVINSNKHFSIFRKHTKVRKDNNDNRFIHHTFKKKKDLYYILLKEQAYIPVKSKRDFIKIYPTQKKVISKFYKTNKNLLKQNFKEFLIKLMITIHE